MWKNPIRNRFCLSAAPLILFDKKNIISFYEYKINKDEIRRMLAQDQNRMRQMSRAELLFAKYERRVIETYHLT